jgi:hypothetical protein
MRTPVGTSVGQGDNIHGNGINSYGAGETVFVANLDSRNLDLGGSILRVSFFLRRVLSSDAPLT